MTTLETIHVSACPTCGGLAQNIANADPAVDLPPRWRSVAQHDEAAAAITNFMRNRERVVQAILPQADRWHLRGVLAECQGFIGALGREYPIHRAAAEDITVRLKAVREKVQQEDDALSGAGL
jgi:hypothetical protein